MLARRLTEHCSAANIRLDEGERIHERTVDVSLGGEVDYRVSIGRELVDKVSVADVALHEPIPRLPFELHEVGKVARVSQFVDHSHLDLRTRGSDEAHEVRADE